MRRFAIVGAVLVASAAAAADPAVRLDAQGDCDLAPAIVRAQQLIGRNPFDAHARDVVHARTTLDARGARAEVEIELADGHVLGPRTVAAASCEQLAGKLAVVLATAVWSLPDAKPRVAPAATDDETPRAAQPPAWFLQATSHEVQIAPHRELAFDAFAGIASGFDRNGARPAGLIGSRVRLGAASLELGLELGAPTDITLANGTTHVATTSAQLGLRPCLALGPIPACALAEAGWVFGHATGVLAAHPGALPVASLGLGSGFEHALTPALSLRARAEVHVNVLGARFEVDQMTVWSSARIEGWLGLDAIARIP